MQNIETLTCNTSRCATLTKHQDMQYRQEMQNRPDTRYRQDMQYIKTFKTDKTCNTDKIFNTDKTCNTSRHSIHQDIQYIKTFKTDNTSNTVTDKICNTIKTGNKSNKSSVARHCMKEGSRRTLEGDSGKRTPSKGLLQDTNLTSCFPMSSCIPLYLLDANDLHSITAFASLRPAVGPSYGLFVEQSADPIDNPARPTLAAPYRAHHTSSESNNDRHEPIGPLLTKNVPQPKRVAKLTL